MVTNVGLIKRPMKSESPSIKSSALIQFHATAADKRSIQVDWMLLTCLIVNSFIHFWDSEGFSPHFGGFSSIMNQDSWGFFDILKDSWRFRGIFKDLEGF